MTVKQDTYEKLADNVINAKKKLDTYLDEVLGRVERKPDEVLVRQYLRPKGAIREVYAPVGEEYVKKAKGMILSAEELTIGQIAVYARWADEPVESETLELAVNGPGPNGPTEMLRKCINTKYTERADVI